MELLNKPNGFLSQTFLLSHVIMCLTQLTKVVLVLSSCSQRTEWDLGVDNLPGRIFRVRRHRQANWHSTVWLA